MPRRPSARGHAPATTSVADVLLNQRVVAGIGNVFKSECLFIAGVYPFTPSRRVSDEELARIVGIARDMLRANTRKGPRPGAGSEDAGRGDSLDRGGALWVYGRGGKPCRKCGTPIQAKKTGIDARLTYWCPRCQPPAYRCVSRFVMADSSTSRH